MNIMERVKEYVGLRHRQTHFRATVDSTSGNRISIIRDGQTTADGQPYPAASGLAASVSPGDEVFVIDMNGREDYYVVNEITR